ncbi:ABC transporter ATP-binding protein [Ottowia oryzae]|nr:ABC transporter ATP-binding protein [Ottowia oryzae]
MQTLNEPEALAPSWLRMRGIVKRFPGVVANDGATLEVAQGEIHALLGENGAGKSTLMQILYGMQKADAGKVELDGRLLQLHSPADAMANGIGMVHQEFMLVAPMTVTENVALTQPPGTPWSLAQTRAHLAATAERYGLAVDPDAKIEHLPIGVQQRVEILKLLCRDARLLILDEPTAVLTPGEKDSLFAVLRSLAKQGRSIIIVKHKLHEIMEIASRVTVMRAGRTVECFPTKDTSPQELARCMVGRDVVLDARHTPGSPGQAVLAVRALHAASDSGTNAVRGACLEVRAGEVLGIAGVDGNGQSELAEAIMGLRPSHEGAVEVDGVSLESLTVAQRRRAGLAYVPADRRHVGSVPELSVGENALLGMQRRLCRLGGWWRDEDQIRAHAQTLVDRFGVRAASIDVAAGSLSGGNLQKVILGRELLLNPKVLLVEQPTRGLDVGAIESVWHEMRSARDNGSAILLISAELEELFALSDRIAVMYEGRIVQVLANDASAGLRERIGLLMAGGDLAEAEAAHALGH